MVQPNILIHLTCVYYNYMTHLSWCTMHLLLWIGIKKAMCCLGFPWLGSGCEASVLITKCDIAIGVLLWRSMTCSLTVFLWPSSMCHWRVDWVLGFLEVPLTSWWTESSGSQGRSWVHFMSYPGLLLGSLSLCTGCCVFSLSLEW